MDFFSFIKVLLRRKWLIIAIVLVATVATYFIANQTPAMYKASTQIATGITDNPEVSVEEYHESKEKSNDAFKTENKFNNLLQIINSRPVLELLSYNLLLHDLAASHPFKDTNELKIYHAPETLQRVKAYCRQRIDSLNLLQHEEARDEQVESLLDMMQYDQSAIKEHLSVWRVAGTDYLELHFESDNPELSAFVVNTLAKEFIRYYRDIKSERTSSSVDFFIKLAHEKKRELDFKTDSLKAFKERHHVVNLSAQTQTMIGKIALLEGNREAERQKILGLSKAITNIGGRFSARGKMFAEAQTSTSNQAIFALKQKLAKLNNRFVTSGMNNAPLQDSIQALRAELAQKIDGVVDEVAFNPNAPKQELVSKKINNEIELEIAKASIASIDKELERLNKEISTFASKDAFIIGLEREIAVAQEVYLNILEKLSAARFAALKTGASLRQAEPALPPEEPEPSKKLLLIAFSAVLSLTFSIVAILVAEYVDLSIRKPSLFEKHTNLRLVGTLIRLDFTKLEIASLFDKGVAKKSKAAKGSAHEQDATEQTTAESSDAKKITAGTPVSGQPTSTLALTQYGLSRRHDTDQMNEKLKVLMEGKSVNASLGIYKESLRKIRYELECTESGKFLFTSTNGGEGKTFMIISLAYSMSLAGKRVLIIDTNFKNNTLSHLFSAKPVLENLQSVQEFDFLLDNLITSTGLEGVDIIGCAGGNYSPAEALPKRQFEHLLAAVRPYYDYIFMEGANLNTYSDTKELVCFADKVLAVFSAESVIKQRDQMAIGYLKSLEGKMLGGVLNKVDLENLDE